MAQKTYPLPLKAADLAYANQNAGKPRHGTAGAADWSNGVTGDDTKTSKASVALISADGDVAEPDYTPRIYPDKVAMANLTAGTVRVTDISRARGYIAPTDPYRNAASPALAAPVVSSISPTTGAAATLPLLVTITGTGFTVWSRVYTGGAALPDNSAKFVNATTMTVPIWAAAPGTVSVAVMDHDVLSNTDKVFTVT